VYVLSRAGCIVGRDWAASVRAHTCVMRETDFHDAEVLLIRLSQLARPNREAALILERVKLYLADQFDRGDHPYVLPAEFAAAGKTTCRFFPREGDTHPKDVLNSIQFCKSPIVPTIVKSSGGMLFPVFSGQCR
jgi:hypothetical protein